MIRISYVPLLLPLFDHQLNLHAQLQGAGQATAEWDYEQNEGTPSDYTASPLTKPGGRLQSAEYVAEFFCGIADH